MKALFGFLAAFAAVAAFAETISEFSLDESTTIDVPAGTTTRIEYLSASSAKTLVKTGGGRLEVAIVGNTNTSIVVAEGTLASVRPGRLDLPEKDRYLHIDANDPDSMELSESNGTNFVSRLNDSDGGPHYLLNVLSGKPFLRPGDLNGLTTIDFGGFRDIGIYGFPPAGHYDVSAAAMTNDEIVLVKDVFYIWRDNDGVKDLPLAVQNGNEVSFCGPTPVSLQSALYRGKGGGGVDFKISNVSPPDSTGPRYSVDGVNISSAFASLVPGEGWHTVNIYFTGQWGASHKASTYGFNMIGGFSSRFGGCRIAEVLICTNTLTAAQRTYVNAYLSSKWFAPKFASIRLEQNAKLDVSAAAWNVGSLDVFGESSIDGENNLKIESICASSNNCVEVSGFWSGNASNSVLLPNLSFVGNGGVDVPGGEMRGNLVYADGVFEKTGGGALGIAYLGGNLSKLSVAEGELVVSALSNPLASMHFDAANVGGMEYEVVDGKKLISRWGDSNGGGRAMVQSPDKYTYDNTRQVNRPYLVENYVGKLPVVDFGSQADCNHADGWGAGLKATHPISASRANPGFLQGFVVWEDRSDSIGIQDVSGCEVAGPPLFSGSFVWRRGDGCNGSGFPLSASVPGYPVYFYASMYVDFVKRDNAKLYRIPGGLHLLDIMPNPGDGGYPVSHVGCNSSSTATNGQAIAGVYGGTRIGEFMFFRYHLPAEQRTRTATTLGAKWFGRENLCEYDEIEVASGAVLFHPYADLSVTALSLSGEISARSVIPRSMEFADGAKISAELRLSDACRLSLSGNKDGLSEISADSLVLDGKCVLDIDDVELAGIFGKKLRVIATSNISGSWKSVGARQGGMPVRINFHVQSDGLYAEFRGSGTVMVIR